MKRLETDKTDDDVTDYQFADKVKQLACTFNCVFNAIIQDTLEYMYAGLCSGTLELASPGGELSHGATELYKAHLFHAMQHMSIVKREGRYFAAFCLLLLLSGNQSNYIPVC